MMFAQATPPHTWNTCTTLPKQQLTPRGSRNIIDTCCSINSRSESKQIGAKKE